MKYIMNSFLQMLSSIRKDMMLFAACLAPVLAGLVFRFGIPQAEKRLCDFMGKTVVLTPYYELFDIALGILAPVMFCFVAAMVILEERDEKQVKYLIVTPLGKRGYLFSRFGIPFFISVLVTLILISIFKLTKLALWTMLFLSVFGAMLGMIVALMIVTLSSNKLEGMAVSKLATLTMIGFMVPYFIGDKVQYILAPLPSFWMGKVIYHGNPFFILPGIAMALVWIGVLMKRFMNS